MIYSNMGDKITSPISEARKSKRRLIARSNKFIPSLKTINVFVFQVKLLFVYAFLNNYANLVHLFLKTKYFQCNKCSIIKNIYKAMFVCEFLL